MEPIEREAIKACVDYIAEYVTNFTVLLTKVRAKSLIGRDDMDYIEGERTGRMKVLRLIEFLQGKQGAFLAFLEILIAEDKKKIAEYIYDRYKKAEGKVRVDLDETEKVLKRDGWHELTSAVQFLTDETEDLPDTAGESFAQEKHKKLKSDGICGSKQQPASLPIHLEEYPMNNNPRGYVLIINNVNWPARAAQANWHFKLRSRPGSNRDRDLLIKLFTDFKFAKPIVKDDCTCTDMLTAISDFAAGVNDFAKCDWKKANAAVVCILTHGDDDGIVYGIDGPGPKPQQNQTNPQQNKIKSVKLREMIKKLDPKNCPALLDKPKLFFIQACRGNKRDNGIDGAELDPQAVAKLDEEPHLLSGQQLEEAIYEPIDQCGSNMKLDGPNPLGAISHIDDFLISFATGWGYFAWRDPPNSSPYITELDRVLRAHPNHDIYHVLTKVKNNVVMSRTQDEMESPGFYTHLSKTLRL